MNEFTLTGGARSVTLEDSMRVSDVEALMRKDLVYQYTPTTTSMPPIGQLTGGPAAWGNVAEPPGIKISQGTIGPNRIAEYCPVGQVTDAFWETTYATFFDRTVKLRLFLGPYLTLNATDTSYSGIEFGSFGTTTVTGPPAGFPTTGNAAGGAVIQLRHVRSTDTFELAVSLGDTITPTIITPLAGVPALDVHGAMVELVIDFPNAMAHAYVDDILGASASFAGWVGTFGLTSTNIVPFLGIFTTSGTHASASAQCYFSHLEFEITDYRTG